MNTDRLIWCALLLVLLWAALALALVLAWRRRRAEYTSAFPHRRPGRLSERKSSYRMNTIMLLCAIASTVGTLASAIAAIIALRR